MSALSLPTIAAGAIARKVVPGVQIRGALVQVGAMKVDRSLFVGNPFTAEIMAAQGFDSVTIDMQHGALDYAALLPMFQAMRASEIGMTLTENFAMLPTAAVSGFYFSLPDSRYFAVGKIGEDQLEDFARRENIGVDAARRRLAPSLD